MGGLDKTFIHFTIAKGILLWQPILEAKIGEIARPIPLFVALSFRNGLRYQNDDGALTAQ